MMLVKFLLICLATTAAFPVHLTVDRTVPDAHRTSLGGLIGFTSSSSGNGLRGPTHELTKPERNTGVSLDDKSASHSHKQPAMVIIPVSDSNRILEKDGSDFEKTITSRENPFILGIDQDKEYNEHFVRWVLRWVATLLLLSCIVFSGLLAIVYILDYFFRRHTCRTCEISRASREIEAGVDVATDIELTTVGSQQSDVTLTVSRLEQCHVNNYRRPGDGIPVGSLPRRE